jgi:serine/threonine protein kinase/WD40 repeat protein
MMPPDASAASASTRDPVEELAEAFLERYRRGERPSLTEFTSRAPEHAAEIRELFPALVLMEQAQPAAASAAAHPLGPLQRLGDYRIVREIGRGGMGIVYEAEQEALGRHVALKVLPTAAGVDSHCLLRFRREARSAARLHHTNIVPVFDIGERDGVHYYAMQFIQGQSLDAVITELRELRMRRNQEGGLPSLAKSAVPAPSFAADLAGSLLSGQFRGGDLVSGASVPIRQDKVNDDASASPPASTSSILNNTSDFSTKSDFHFYRSVARIGLQIAEALTHAHGQRVLHRDIKPANLLLDARGTIWVTDFGLAKEEGGAVTRTGEVIGTLRYMAPERLNGISDARSDIYSLGLTLYEMLTLRPAFPEADRAGLVHAITHREPSAPRRLDPHLPRDLETIVLKAIAKEPAGRYATAESMAEDLRRFLADRPIHARRTSSWERVRRWCRRNPGWAATIATVVGLLVVMALGGTILSLHLHQALSDVQAGDVEKTERLWQSHLERARALRSSGRVGQRFEALKAIREAARIKVTDELRNEAVAALVLPDVKIDREWDGYPDDTLNVAYDAKFERCARIDKRGKLTLCRLSPDGEQIIAQLPAHGEPLFWGLWMSPDGRFLAHGYSGKEGFAGGVKIWKLDGPTPLDYMDVSEGMHLYALSFHADGRLAIGHADGRISVYDLGTKELLQRWKIERAPNTLAFHPTDNRLAAACKDSVRLFDADTGKESARFQLPQIDTWSWGLAWHPDGRVLAATSEDRKIHLWDTQTSAEIAASLEGHNAPGIFMAFNHKGDRLISVSLDRQARLWNSVTGRLLLTIPGTYGTQFSSDDSLIGLERSGTKLRLWRLADGRELRTIRRPTAGHTETIYAPVLDAEDRALAAASNVGLGFFDFESGKELAFIKNLTGVFPKSFDPADGWMTHSSRNALLWPVRRDPSQVNHLHVGPPRLLAATVNAGADATMDGRFRIFPQGDRALVLDREHPGQTVEIGDLHDVRNCAISRDGKWVATCSWFWDGRTKSVRIWEPDWEILKARHVVDLSVEGGAYAAFSPDGKWLATYGGGHGPNVLAWAPYCQVWEVGTWRAGKRFKNHFCWNADGRLLAVHDERNVIRLVQPDSGKEVFRLTGPDAREYAAGCLTQDGANVIATVSDNSALYVWDLRLIRNQLRELGMDWEWPEFAPLTPRSPVTIAVDPGGFRRPVFESNHHDLAAFSVALALQPLTPDAYFHRGLAYARLRDWRRAMVDCEMFLSLTPSTEQRRPEVTRNYAQACNNVAWEFVVKPPVQQAAAEAALSLAQKAVSLDPHYFNFQNTLGVALYRLGRYEESIRCLEPNVKLSGQYAAFDLYFLAMSHQRLGHSAEAHEYFEQANASAKAETGLSPGHRQELAAFRAEAERVLGIVKE